MRRAIIASMTLVVGMSTAFTAIHLGAASPLEQTLHSDGAPGLGEGGQPATFVHTYVLDTRGLADRIAAEGRSTLELQEGLTVDLHLQEMDLFLPGHRRIVYVDEEGRTLREEPILARTFRGHVIGTDVPVFLVIAPEGIYGAVRHDGIEHSLQPRQWNDGLVLQEVVWDAAPTWEPSVDLQGLAEREGFSQETMETTSAGRYGLVVAPYAEPSFRAAKSDWFNWIANAYGYGWNMWMSETNIEIALHDIIALTNDRTGGSYCGGAYDYGMLSFQNWLYGRTISGVNSYGLFHGYGGTPGTWGCGSMNCRQTGYGCLQAASGSPEHLATHTIQAVDQSSTDDYDATRADHQGKAIHHELTHNAGEQGHPARNWCWTGQQHLMNADSPMSCRGMFRLTDNTIQDIQIYGYPRLHWW